MPVEIPGLEGLILTQQGHDYTIAYLRDCPTPDDPLHHLLESSEGTEATIARLLVLLDQESQDDSLDQCYGAGHRDRCVATINTLRDPGVYVISFRLEYGVLVVY